MIHCRECDTDVSPTECDLCDQCIPAATTTEGAPTMTEQPVAAKPGEKRPIVKYTDASGRTWYRVGSQYKPNLSAARKSARIA